MADHTCVRNRAISALGVVSRRTRGETTSGSPRGNAERGKPCPTSNRAGDISGNPQRFPAVLRFPIGSAATCAAVLESIFGGTVMAVLVLLEGKTKPEMVGALKAALPKLFPATRAYKGCRGITFGQRLSAMATRLKNWLGNFRAKRGSGCARTCRSASREGRNGQPGCNPSIVVMLSPSTALRATLHERVALPPTCTVQAPHRPMPQPNFVPVRPSSSRMTQSNGVS